MMMGNGKLLKVSLGILIISTLIFGGCNSIIVDEEETPSPTTTPTATASSTNTPVDLPKDFHAKLAKDNCSWDSQSGTVTIKKDVIFGGDNDIQSFYWQVPAAVKKIFINKNVKITGGFRTNHALTLEGEDRKTSVIYGTNTKVWKQGRVDDEWDYTALSATGIPNGGALTIKSLTIENSRTYNVNSYDSKIIVDNCSIINTRGASDGNSNNDGFGGGAGSEIKNSYLAVNDDVIKIYKKDMKITNVTINLHCKNSVAFQMGWDDKGVDAAASATLTNVLVTGTAPVANDNKPGYNQGIFAWKGGSAAQTRTITLDRFKVTGLDNTVLWHDKWVDMALVTLWRSNGTLILKGDNVCMSAPVGSYPNGTTKIQFSNLNTTTVNNSYNTGSGKDVTGNGTN